MISFQISTIETAVAEVINEEIGRKSTLAEGGGDSNHLDPVVRGQRGSLSPVYPQQCHQDWQGEGLLKALLIFKKLDLISIPMGAYSSTMWESMSP